jgi:hypothetical protein
MLAPGQCPSSSGKDPMADSPTELALRARLLRDDLRLIRLRADISATGATIHQLRSSIATAQSALQMADRCLEGGDRAALDFLLTLAQEALQNAREIIAQTHPPKGEA